MSILPSGFIRRPPFLQDDVCRPQLLTDIIGAHPLLVLGDGITTDHISPVSRIVANTPASEWLGRQGVPLPMQGSYSSRRLNHEVMLRGGFANPRLSNKLVPGIHGGFTKLLPDGTVMPVHEAAEHYRLRRHPIVVVAGARYGAGSARDWAAKVTRLLGICAVIARGFERIHRSNLVAFGVLPIELDNGPFDIGENFVIDLLGLPGALTPGGTLELVVRNRDTVVGRTRARCRIDTEVEAEWLRAGGVLPRLLLGQPTAV